MQHSIVFIHVGSSIPHYTRDALAQARMFNDCAIRLVAEADALKDFAIEPQLRIETVAIDSLPISPQHERFRATSIVRNTPREEFEAVTTERFYILDTYISQHHLQHVFHLENDVMLYADLESLLPIFQRRFPGLASTLDNDERCVPGFVYAPHPKATVQLIDFIDQVRTQPLGRKYSDMRLLGSFSQSAGERCLAHLPIVPREYPSPLRSRLGHVPRSPQLYSNFIEDFDSLFDAAAIGQYLGGVRVPPDSAGFINESCVFDPSVFSYAWETDARQRRIPVLREGQKAHRLNNLHVPSKNLQAFRSDLS